jgi:septal ring-binding cell division protein DamX
VTDRARTRRVIERTAHGRDATDPHPFAGRAGLDILDVPSTRPHVVIPVEAVSTNAPSTNAVPVDAAWMDFAPVDVVPNAALTGAPPMGAVPGGRRSVHAGSGPAYTPEGAVNVHRNR